MDKLLEAVKILLADKNTLFESMVAKLYEYPELKEMVYSLLFHGKEIPYNSLNHVIEIASMFGFIRNDKGAGRGCCVGELRTAKVLW